MIKQELTLRETTQADLQDILPCERRFAQFVGQWSEQQHRDALGQGDVFHGVFADWQGTFAGYLILKGLQNPNHSVELMRIAVDAPGRGLGAAALTLAKRYAFEVLQANRLWLDVRQHNLRAQKAYEAAGFTREGLLREAVLVDGAYQSLYVMSVLRSEWEQAKP